MSECLSAMISAGVPCETICSAMYPGAGSDIDDVVTGADGFFIVFDDDHGVAKVAQVGEGVQQALVVALMQTDGGFVEYVHDAHQAGANLAGQADALRLAAGEGFRAAIE